ncbi:MAG: S1 RNA-binding domain-containing protein [Anaerolineales bacterium]|nr:S1 RNA-binding domain-containing protein [Anaerolineales bacterium]
MNFLLNEELNLPTAGEIRQGWVVSQQGNEILVDIGAKSEGIIPNQEVEKLDKETRDLLSPGSEVLVFVVDPEDQNGNVILSYVKAAQEQDWQLAESLMNTQEVYEGPIIGFNKGGLLIRVGQLRGFVPNSQLELDRFSDRQITPSQLQKMVGKSLGAKVIEVSKERNRLILSERAAGKELREAKRNRLLDSIQEGDAFDGRVVNLTEYGAFVDIGGIEGLVHVSELSWKRVKKPADILQVGDKVKVAVISVDQDKQRIALSMKRLEADPWSEIDKLYQEGQLIEATITKLTKFGAFARLNDDYELEGLIHISELSEDHVEHPREILKPSDVIMVRVIRIAPEQRQLGLSIKEVSSAKYIEADMALLATN